MQSDCMVVINGKIKESKIILNILEAEAFYDGVIELNRKVEGRVILVYYIRNVEIINYECFKHTTLSEDFIENRQFDMYVAWFIDNYY